MLKYHIRTYGCQMNERDSEAISALLGEHGFQSAHGEEDADILLFNTCSVREQAESKAIGKIGIIKRLKRRKPDLVIVVVGCMAQRKGEEIIDEMPHVDLVIGTGQLHRLPDILEEHLADRTKRVRIGEDPDLLDRMGAHEAGSGVCANVAIMRGCNRFCSYCIVPYVRGRESDRKPDDILREVRSLAANGIRDVLLLGQNVAAYGLGGAPPPLHPDHSPFADLLERVNEVEGILRIRFTSPHPAYFNRRLIETILRLPKVCDCVHLPLQSGSDRILERMNRPYTAEQYLEIVDSLRAGRSDITFSTDVIVGFPGETDEDFQKTRSIMDRVNYDNAFIFKYSPRRGTAAATWIDDVPKAIKEERNQILLDDLAKRTLANNRRWIGRTVDVLVEGPSKRNADRWCGRTSQNKVVIFTPRPGSEPGTIIPLEIRRATSMSLFADSQ